LGQTLRDYPGDLNLVHSDEKLPDLPFLIHQLYETDSGRCYLAAKTILENYSEEAPVALFAAFAEEANNDYGAHFHVVKLFGWLKHCLRTAIQLSTINCQLSTVNCYKTTKTMTTDALFEQLKHPNPHLRDRAMFEIADSRDENTISRLVGIFR
jgi:hypothetical protein